VKFGTEDSLKTLGIIPARMAASRFPGKPLCLINGKPMIQHVYERASSFKSWDELVVATCDREIAEFAEYQGYRVTMTGAHHTRALDRVAEAAEILGAANNDMVVCVQGDEPLLTPDMLTVLLHGFKVNPETLGTVLAMQIVDEAQWRNPDTVKIIANSKGEVLYTSRTPVPYNKGEFTLEMEARRIFGLFAFRMHALRAFTECEPTRLELLEACDSNRILDMDFVQHIAPYPYVPAFSVDSPDDISLVEAALRSSERADL
jgi:3-deoxy-manno-octulosonate cytidylyltransferase (CMP-KDO synthetase)